MAHYAATSQSAIPASQPASRLASGNFVRVCATHFSSDTDYVSHRLARSMPRCSQFVFLRCSLPLLSFVDLNGNDDNMSRMDHTCVRATAYAWRVGAQRMKSIRFEWKNLIFVDDNKLIRRLHVPKRTQINYDLEQWACMFRPKNSMIKMSLPNGKWERVAGAQTQSAAFIIIII